MTTYGAVARAEALRAGYERWWEVTRWPIVTQSVTSVDPDSDDPKNVGTEPEGDSNWGFCPPEGHW